MRGMQRLLLALAPIAALFAAPAAAQDPEPAEVQVFQDWYAVCDNGGACEAGSLGNDYSFDGAMAIRIRRAMGPDGAFRIVLFSTADSVTGADLTIGGQVWATGAIDEAGGLVVAADRSLALARALAAGRDARIVFRGPDAAAQSVTISLAGSSAALRYLDAGQKRSGTVGAIVATGLAPDTATPPELPLVRQVRPRSKMLEPDTGQIAAVKLPDECELPEGFGAQPEIGHLHTGPNGDTVLVLIPCGAGAYNFLSMAYIATREPRATEWDFRLAEFDWPPGGWTAEYGPLQLVNASFEDGVLAAFAKGRGIGDCGNAQSYVWDGARFRLVEASSMPECRGVWDWPTVWRARFERYRGL